MEIKGSTALITGAAKRVGKEIALELARRGASICLHYHTSEKEAHATAAEIRALGVDCNLFQSDLSDTADTVRMAEKVLKAHSLDILVNSASLFYRTPIGDVTEKDWDSLVDSNLKGPFFLSKTVGTRMTHGKIVNIADWSGFRPYKNYAPYCAAKGGLITLTKSLAKELAPKVQCNAVAPGPVLPPPNMTEEEKAVVAKQTLLGRWGTPHDIACAVAFLIENDFINGTVLVVDGGRSIV